MSIKIKCPACSATLALKKSLFEHKGEFVIACPNCSKKIKIKGAQSSKRKLQEEGPKTQLFSPTPKTTEYHLIHDGSEQMFSLNLPYLIFGRASNNKEVQLQFVTNDPTISRKHCVFRKYSDGITIEDVSKGGTFVDGKRLEKFEEKYLYRSSKIRMGNQEFSIAIVESQEQKLV